MSLKQTLFQLQFVRFTSYGTEIGAVKGPLFSAETEKFTSYGSKSALQKGHLLLLQFNNGGIVLPIVTGITWGASG